MSRHAAAAFLASMASIRENVAKLNELIDGQFGYNLDDIHWGHAGTAAHVADQLKNIVATFDKA